ncbi:MAG: hypothetical protein ACYDA0_04610 [Candidatus Dormibacteraceae bacterium]
MTRPRALLAAFGTAAVIATLPAGVQAETPGGNGGTIEVGPNSEGSTVSQGSAGYDPNGITATASSQPSGSGTTPTGPTYIYHPVPNNAIPAPGPIQNNNGTLSNPNAALSQPACPVGQTGYYVYDSNGNSLGLICVPNPSDNLPPPTNPEIALAEQASSQQPWPVLVMGVNPAVGLTGLPSWFWLTGGNPRMPDATATARPLTVTVHAALAGVTWEFGDGLGYDSSDLGRPYPQPSDVTHIYQSDTFGRPQGLQVRAVLRYEVTYRVNGGPWQQLGVKTTSFAQQYSVYQLQPEAIPAA